MKELIGGVAFTVLFVLLLLVAPIIFLWSLNTLGEYSTGFYIDHNVWTYLATYGIAGVLRGGK